MVNFSRRWNGDCCFCPTMEWRKMLPLPFTRTVHMIQYCYTLLLLLPKVLNFFAFLTLFHFLFFNCVGSVNHQYQMSCSTFSFLHFFIKFYSSIEIDCCIFFLSEILVKNVLRSFLWIQDFIILGTQDPGILRS